MNALDITNEAIRAYNNAIDEIAGLDGQEARADAIDWEQAEHRVQEAWRDLRAHVATNYRVRVRWINGRPAEAYYAE